MTEWASHPFLWDRQFLSLPNIPFHFSRSDISRSDDIRSSSGTHSFAERKKKKKMGNSKDCERKIVSVQSTRQSSRHTLAKRCVAILSRIPKKYLYSPSLVFIQQIPLSRTKGILSTDWRRRRRLKSSPTATTKSYSRKAPLKRRLQCRRPTDVV